MRKIIPVLGAALLVAACGPALQSTSATVDPVEASGAFSPEARLTASH
ncbi:hypothetical protein [Halioglobus sp. HI00S01]|nr:hypothetical protein [Halioglobus sp. HI00S01]